MGMLVNVVVADLEDAGAIIESEKPVEEWKGLEANGLDPAKFAMLHALLSGELFDDALDECGPLHAASDEGPWLMKLPDDSVAHLAELEEGVGDRLVLGAGGAAGACQRGAVKALRGKVSE